MQMLPGKSSFLIFYIMGRWKGAEHIGHTECLPEYWQLVTSAQGSQRPLPSAEFVRVRLPACMSAELCPVACSWDFRLREHHKFVCCRGQHTSVWSLAEHVRFAGLFLWTAGNSVRTTPHLGARLLRRIQTSMFTVPEVIVSSTPPSPIVPPSASLMDSTVENTPPV